MCPWKLEARSAQCGADTQTRRPNKKRQPRLFFQSQGRQHHHAPLLPPSVSTSPSPPTPPPHLSALSPASSQAASSPTSPSRVAGARWGGLVSRYLDNPRALLVLHGLGCGDAAPLPPVPPLVLSMAADMVRLPRPLLLLLLLRRRWRRLFGRMPRLPPGPRQQALADEVQNPRPHVSGQCRGCQRAAAPFPPSSVVVRPDWVAVVVWRRRSLRRADVTCAPVDPGVIVEASPAVGPSCRRLSAAK